VSGRDRRVEIALPAWLDDEPVVLGSRQDRMRHVVALARRNVREGTGGPFGAAVVRADSGEVLGVGVNLVVTARNSTAHAEMVALQIAERRVGRYDLGDVGPVQLVCSVEPCAMCLGAVVWSGVASLVCGASDADARGIGFDEGPKPADWVAALSTRRIEVQRGLLREDAVAVLQEYAASGGVIYNAARRSAT